MVPYSDGSKDRIEHQMAVWERACWEWRRDVSLDGDNQLESNRRQNKFRVAQATDE
jgi:hypothetical protein